MSDAFQIIVAIAVLWVGFAVAWCWFMDRLSDREFERELRRAEREDDERWGM